MRWLVSILVFSLIVPMAMGGLVIPPSPFNEVVPKEGSLYITQTTIDRLEDFYSYTYKVDLKTIKEISKAQDPINLQIYNPETDKWIDTNANGTKDSTRLGVYDYRVNFAKLDLGMPFLGTSKYRLVDANGTALKDANGYAIEFSGPNIIVNLRDETYAIQKESGKNLYSYGVLARSDRTVPIDIRGTRDGRTWEWYGYPVKSGSRGWTKLEWINAPYFQKMEFAISK
jgi:hypothetical protein